MKRTDRLTIFIAVLLFLGFLAYLGSYAFRALENGVVTAEAISADFDLSGTASGILIREETVLTSTGMENLMEGHFRIDRKFRIMEGTAEEVLPEQSV